MRILSLSFLSFLSLVACHVDAQLSIKSMHPDAATRDTKATESEIIVTAYKSVPRHILLVGDSEAGRVSWRVKDVKESDDVVHVVYKGGTTIQQWGAGGLFNAALTKYPSDDTVVIFLGTNDYSKTTTPDVAPILRQVTAAHMNCVWVGPTSVHEKSWSVNDLIEAAVSSTCTYFNTEKMDIKLEDHVHPNYDNAGKWLGMVWLMIPPKFEETTDE
jgi:hypothetical protein